MQISDSLALDASGLKLTRDGYLIGDAKVARAGNVQQYLGYELGMTGDDANKMFGVYRDPDAVFDRDSMLSLAGRPVTRDHPPEGVNASNWKDLAIGQVGGVIRKDGEHVVAPMAIMDAKAAKEVADGARSLSAGYTCDVQREEGVAADGTPYQFKQTGPIRFNHVAYLPNNNPRAGNTRIGDDSSARTPNRKDNTPMTKSVIIDGKQHEVTDEVAAHLAKLTADNKAQSDTLKDAVAQIDAAKTVIATAKADREAAEKAAADAKADADKAEAAKKATADVQKTAEQLIDTMEKAKKLVPALDVKGKTADAIKKEAVSQKLGDKAVEGKDAAFFDAAFTMLTADAAKGDPVADALKAGTQTVADEGDKAFNDYVAGLSKAWQTPVAKAN